MNEAAEYTATQALGIGIWSFGLALVILSVIGLFQLMKKHGHRLPLRSWPFLLLAIGAILWLISFPMMG